MFEKVEYYNEEYGMFDYMWILYDSVSENEIKIKRVLATNPNIVIPLKISDMHVTTIGSYCFAKNGHLTENEIHTLNEKLKNDFGLCEMSGSDVHSVVLSDSVQVLESYAFYQCRELRYLEIGTALDTVHNDVFMNCRKLHNIKIRGGISQKSGIKFILSRLNLDVEVDFVDEKEENTRLFYPEYTESYEEIGPAHIFGLNVEGEGYRARQSFNDGIVDISKYDSIFEKSTNLENMDVLLQMALDRLMYPYGLSQDARTQYETFIVENAETILLYIVEKENLNQLEYLAKLKLIGNTGLKKAISKAVNKNWTKGCAKLIKMGTEVEE